MLICIFYNYIVQFHITPEFQDKFDDLPVEITHLIERVNDVFKKNEIPIQLTYHCHVLLNVSEKTGAYEPNNKPTEGAFGLLRKVYNNDGEDENNKANVHNFIADNALRYSADLAIILGASPLSEPHMGDAGKCVDVILM